MPLPNIIIASKKMAGKRGAVKRKPMSREKAVIIAMNHKCISKEEAESYTTSELQEILTALKIKTKIK